MQILRRVVAGLLILLLLPLGVAIGEEQQVQQRDSHLIFRFTELPDPNYFFRNFQLRIVRPIKDATGIDSDRIIRDCPMALSGFLSRWLQPGQKPVILEKQTQVVMLGCRGEPIRVNLNKGEAVIYDTATNDILAVSRCANKVTDGKFEPPSPEVKITQGEKGEKGEPGLPGRDGRDGERGEKGDRGEMGLRDDKGEKGGFKKKWLVGGLILVGAVVIVGFSKHRDTIVVVPGQKPNVQGNGDQIN